MEDSLLTSEDDKQENGDDAVIDDAKLLEVYVQVTYCSCRFANMYSLKLLFRQKRNCQMTELF